MLQQTETVDGLRSSQARLNYRADVRDDEFPLSHEFACNVMVCNILLRALKWTQRQELG